MQKITILLKCFNLDKTHIFRLLGIPRNVKYLRSTETPYSASKYVHCT